MSQTTTVPRGLDTMDADDLALLKDMQDDAPAPQAEPASDAPAVTDEASQIELPDEDEPQPRGRQPRTETVPHAKFAAALAERKAANTARDEARALATAEKERADAAEAKAVAAAEKAAELEKTAQLEQARINERIAILNAAMQQQPAPVPQAVPAAPAPVVEEPLPDVNTDPIGYFKGLYERVEKARVADRAEMAELKTAMQGYQQQQTVVDQITEMRNWASAQENAFKRQESSYDAAMDFLRQNREEELFELGMADPAQRLAAYQQDLTAIAHTARRDGANPAERLYRMAVRRGFQKPAAPVAAAPVTPAAAPAATIPPLDAELASVDRAARIEEGRQNATTIGSLGSAPARTMSVEQILSLPDERFAELAAQLRERGRLQELMGG